MTAEEQRKRILADPHLFYTSSAWLKLRAEVLESDHYECQICKANGKYTPAEIVHHVNHLRRHPELGLSAYYQGRDGTRKRNLLSVCRECHETVCHPERMRKNQAAPVTRERWD